MRPNLNPGFAFALFGYGMVFVGMLGTVLYAVDDLALQGTVFEEAVLIYIVYGAVLGRDGRRRLLGAEAVGQRPVGGQGRAARAARRAGHRARLVPALHRRLPRPARRRRSTTTTTSSSGTSSCSSATPSWASPCWPSSGCSLSVNRSRDGERDTIGDDPWDGQTLEWATTSPAPGDNFVDVPVVHSAEPMLDLKADRRRPAPRPTGAATDVRTTPRPRPAPRRQTLVGMAFATVAIVMLTGGMLAVWLLQRDRRARRRRVVAAERRRSSPRCPRTSC